MSHKVHAKINNDKLFPWRTWFFITAISHLRKFRLDRSARTAREIWSFQLQFLRKPGYDVNKQWRNVSTVPVGYLSVTFDKWEDLSNYNKTPLLIRVCILIQNILCWCLYQKQMSRLVKQAKIIECMHCLTEKLVFDTSDIVKNIFWKYPTGAYHTFWSWLSFSFASVK